MTDVRNRQRADALNLANARRSRTAELKRALKSGRISLQDALVHPELQDWKIGDIVGFCCIGTSRWQGSRTPSKAPKRALDLLEAAKVGHARKVRDVTTLERGMMLRRASIKEERRAREHRARLEIARR